jgi:hypothetical protein
VEEGGEESEEDAWTWMRTREGKMEEAERMDTWAKKKKIK